MKKTVFILVSIFFTISLIAQDMSEVFQTKSATWFGFDYSEAYFIGTDGFTEPDEIKNRFFNSWNELVENEYDKYNIGRYFRKESIDFSLDIVTSRNKEVDIYNRITNDSKKANLLDDKKVQEIINEYNFTDEQQGLGIVFIVESYSKTIVTGNYFVTLFDIDSKKVLLTERISGKAKGFGMRNYWAHSYYKVMKNIDKYQYKSWTDKYNK
jgi:hypothetical protein